MSTPHSRAVAALLLLAATAAGQATVSELNRAYVIEGTKLWAVNAGGGLAWDTTVSGLEHSAWHPCLDPVREVVWLVEQTTLSLRRYSLQGNLELSIPIPGTPFGTLLRAPAVDRDGNCYIVRLDPDYGPLSLDGYRNWLMKFDPNGALIHETDITPTTGLQIPLGQASGRFTRMLWIDEDQNVWAYIWWERVAKFDPNGLPLFHAHTSNRGMVLNPDRTLWHYHTDFNVSPTLRRLDKLSLDGSVVQQTLSNVSGTEFLAHASGAPLRWEFPYSEPPLPQANPLISEFCPVPNPGLGYAHITCGDFGQGDPERLADVRSLAVSVDGTRLVAVGQRFNGAGYPTDLPRLVEYGPFSPPAGPLLPSGYPVASYTNLGPPPLVHSNGNNNTTNRFTAYEYCLITDPWGDVDGDGCLNRNEIMAGANPCDPASKPAGLTLASFQPGSGVSFQLDAPADSSLAYYSVLSLLSHPLPLADARLFGPSPFEVDPISPFWIAPGLVTGAAGSLDANGQATISTALPADPQLVGVELCFGYGTFDVSWSLGVKSLFGPVTLTIGSPGFSSP